MIVTKIIGGLGNQMFQYAAGLALAEKNNVPLLYDISTFSSAYKIRRFQLNCFNISASEHRLKNSNVIGNSWIIKRFCDKFSLFKSEKIFIEKSYNYDPAFFDIKPNTFIEGYWQSEKYFENIENIVRKEFTFKNDPYGLNCDWLAKIEDSISVSLHVRRGDYIYNKEANEFHGTCSLDYYTRAVAQIADRINGKPKLFIFSDDPDWTKNNINLLGFEHSYIGNNNEENCYEDLRLMAACKYHIIANSTFSWWGAWLDSRKDSFTIAPKQWFASNKLNSDDVIPERWLRV